MINNWSYLDELESEAIFVLRETAAQFEKSALLFSGGKDSIVLIHLAQKAFYPAPIPFTIVHIDTGHNFPETMAFRDAMVARMGLRLVVGSVQASIDIGKVREEKGFHANRNILQSATLLEVIQQHHFDAAIGGARRDEEKSRAKERFFSHRDEFGRWDPRNQRPELWNLFNGRKLPGEHFRIFPLSNWTESDVWQYILDKQIEVPTLYFAHEREVILRDGILLSVSPWIQLKESERPTLKKVRFRTCGDMPITGAILSEADSVEKILEEIKNSRTSERSTRFDDHRSENAMEDRKRMGYFYIQVKQLLRFTTAGSVDDGKSTLIGRLLFDTHSVLEDQWASLKLTSQQKGFDYVDFSLLTDGLKSERDQGITIDVAYRFFESEKMRFIITDTPGHFQYTRNMVTGASNADLILILVDATKGLTEQTFRHSYIASLLKIKQVVVCINKMDLVEWNESVFNNIVEAYKRFSSNLDFKRLDFVPISALSGDQVVQPSRNMTWYTGHTLIEILELANPNKQESNDPFRFPVQFVIRHGQETSGNTRHYAGQIISGSIKTGDPIIILPSGRHSNISAIYSGNQELSAAEFPMSVSFTLTNELDINRGDLFCRSTQAPQELREFNLMVCWLSPLNGKMGNRFLVRHHSSQTTGILTQIHNRLDIGKLEREKVAEIGMNDIAMIRIRTADSLFLDSYSNNRAMGSLLLIDEFTGETLAAGMYEKTTDE